MIETPERNTTAAAERRKKKERRGIRIGELGRSDPTGRKKRGRPRERRPWELADRIEHPRAKHHDKRDIEHLVGCSDRRKGRDLLIRCNVGDEKDDGGGKRCDPAQLRQPRDDGENQRGD